MDKLKNYQGMFIEAQGDNLDTSELFKKLKMKQNQ